MTATELIRDFVNTRDVLEAEEQLGSPGQLTAWLEGHGVADGKVAASPGDLERARDLREALRLLLLRNTGLELEPAEALAVLDGAARRAQVGLVFGAGLGELVPAAGGVDGALGRIVVAVHDAMADGSWSRLKACRASDCEWAFIDNARNHSRAWCSMKSCGNREKARAFRERHRASD